MVTDVVLIYCGFSVKIHLFVDTESVSLCSAEQRVIQKLNHILTTVHRL